MKKILILLTLTMTSTVFSAETLSSIEVDNDLKTLSIGTSLKFHNDLEFSSYFLNSDFTMPKPDYKTSRGFNVYCTMRTKQGTPGLDPNVIITANTIAKITKISQAEMGPDYVYRNLGPAYTIEANAETPNLLIPITIRCRRNSGYIMNTKDLPNDLTIQEFIDVGNETFSLIPGESVESEKAPEKEKEPIQKPVIRPEAKPVVNPVVKPELKPEPKIVAPVQAPVAVVVKKLKIECDFKDESTRERIYLDVTSDSLGNSVASGYKNGVEVAVKYNKRRTQEGRTIFVSFDGATLNKSLAPGIGSISFETGMVTKMLGIKRKLKVECNPESERLEN